MVFPSSSVNAWNIFLFESVAIDDHRSPSSPFAGSGGSSSSDMGSKRNDADRSVSKNDSRTSSASTTIRKLSREMSYEG